MISLLIKRTNGWDVRGSYRLALDEINNQPPVIELFEVAHKYYSQVGLPYTFSATAYDSDGDELSYYWDFGDGTTSNQPYGGKVYHDPGNYIVTLTVTDGYHSIQETREIIVRLWAFRTVNVQFAENQKDVLFPTNGGSVSHVIKVSDGGGQWLL